MQVEIRRAVFKVNFLIYMPIITSAETKMNSFPIATLNDRTFFTQELVLDKNFILLDTACPWTDKLKNALVEWGFKVVYSNGNLSVTSRASPSAAEFENVSFENVSITDVTKESEKEVEIGAEVKKTLQEAHSKISGNEKSRMNIVQTVYNEYTNYINAVYTRYATHKTFNYDELTETVKELCIFIKDNRRFVLRIQPANDGKNKNFIINHSMRSTVLSIVIGLQMRIPLTKLIDLGITSILHEIGQIRLPPQLYLTERKLSPAERTKLATHPILGFRIMKENGFSSQIQLGVLQHHERENGSGYPQKLYGEQISLFAKIIGVACSFEAITAARSFKEARSSHEAIVEILRNEDNKFDPTVIKALLYAISLYPIGAYVYLLNGKIAQVTDANPGNPGNPIVSILGETDSQGAPKTIQTDNASNKIVRVLNKQEAQDILKQFGMN